MIAIQIGLGTDNYLYPLHELIAWDNRNMRKRIEIYYCTQDDSIDCPIHQGEWIGWVEGAVVGEDEKAR